MKELNKDDKWFLGFMSVAFVILGTLIGGLAVMIVVAICQAGLTSFLWIAGIGLYIAWASRLLYLAALKNNWIDKI